MIDITKLTYHVYLIREKGKPLVLSNIVETVGWEENKGELAMRVNLSLKNHKYKGKNISSIVKLGSMIVIYAKHKNKNKEVARGIVTNWSVSTSNSAERTDLTCYDELYALQKSQDNIYFAAGISTKNAIMSIFRDWNIPLASYDGPDKKHGKLVYKTDTIGDVILDILDDAVKKGSEKYNIRSTKGNISIQPLGSNKTVYHFGGDNTSAVSHSLSTADMITRVKVIGREDDDEKSSIEAVVDGNTQFGIRQKIYIRGKDDTREDAIAAAEELLEESGDIEKTISVDSPDVPYIRKGDVVHMKAGTLNGYYYILGIRHDGDTGTMSMDLKKAKNKTGSGSGSNTSEEFSKGDKVILNGAVYVDSYGNGKGKTFTNRTCTITIKVDITRECPYHVDGIGWVYPDSIKKA